MLPGAAHLLCEELFRIGALFRGGVHPQGVLVEGVLVEGVLVEGFMDHTRLRYTHELRLENIGFCGFCFSVL